MICSGSLTTKIERDFAQAGPYNVGKGDYMGRIIILDENTSNKIAAGEVVERPASVVKELTENSIDAGATNISVDIKNGGISYIKVTDNGSGMEEDDVELAFERHATSKIKRAEDLDSIITMGFRGEALASIAAVSSVELQTRTAGSTYGMYVHINGGVLKEVRQTGCPVGTTFIIKDLFFNTPARYKFLKKDSTEAGYISDTITRIALGNPDIAFRLTSGKMQLVNTPGNNDLKSTVFSIYGREIIKDLIAVDYQDDKFKITGYIGKPESSRANRNYQSLYINKRYIKSKLVSYAVEQAYASILMKNKFPFYVLNIELNPHLVDANVHPNKMDVRFADESYLSKALYMAVSKSLSSGSLFNPVSMPEKDREIFKFKNTEPEKVFVQEQLIRHGEVHNSNASSIIDSSIIKENKTAKNNSDEIRILTEALEPLKRTDLGKGIYGSVSAERHESLNIPGNITSHNTQNTEPIFRIMEKETHELEAAEEASQNTEIELTQMKYIGQAFSTYIILQDNAELVLIDQHAAHERILYEKLKTKFESQDNTTQLLLEPSVVQLQAIEHNAVKFQEELLNRIGFIFEDFGNNSIIIRGVPYMLEGSAPKDIFLEITDKLLQAVNPVKSPLADEIMHTIACKAAIKANKKLNDPEVQQLLTDLSNTGKRYTCPHGRPTIIRLTKYEIEKMFKRIV